MSTDEIDPEQKRAEKACGLRGEVHACGGGVVDSDCGTGKDGSGERQARAHASWRHRTWGDLRSSPISSGKLWAPCEHYARLLTLRATSTTRALEEL